jgi:uncharacterized protein (TIGR03067 family)
MSPLRVLRPAATLFCAIIMAFHSSQFALAAEEELKVHSFDEALVGRWQPLSVRVAGETTTRYNNTVVVIRPHQMLTEVKGKVVKDAALRHVLVDGSSEFRCLDVFSLEAVHKDAGVDRAIYRIQDDVLEICIDPTGKHRPQSFKANVGSPFRWIKLKKLSEQVAPESAPVKGE